MQVRTFFILTNLLLSWSLAAQDQQFQRLTYPVTQNGQTLQYPFAGGLNAPQFSAADLNNDQIPDLVDVFDFAVNEQCHEFDECRAYAPFVEQGKPVFNAEYAAEFVDDPSQVCADALDRDLRTLILPLDLDGSFRISCD